MIEKLHSQDIFETLSREPEIQKYFTVEELRALAPELTKVIHEVLEGREVKDIIFAEDDKMFFDLNNNTLHIGLGIIKQMAKVWTNKEKIQQTLRSDAAHEAGHRVIDFNPIKDLGIPAETWNQLGISSLANALMDCRNDGRIMAHYPDLKEDMQAGIEFNFMQGGRLDWLGEFEKNLLLRGSNPLFTQFDSEAMRIWAQGNIHALADTRVKNILDKHTDDIRFVSSDSSCVPAKNPSLLEAKAKAKKTYQKVAAIYNGEYQELLNRDRDNQTVHQALSLIGLYEKKAEIPEQLQKLLEEKLTDIPPALQEELSSKLALQKQEQERYEKTKNEPLFAISTTGLVEIKKRGALEDLDKSEWQGRAKQLFDILGPAIRVEELSEELREFLKKLFAEMQNVMVEHMLSEFLKALLADPEKVLKEIEDAFSDKIRPHTIPSTVPNHQEVDTMPPPVPTPPTKLIVPGVSTVVNQKELLFTTPRELEATEKWLDDHIDMNERIHAWREAIYAAIRAERRKTAKPKLRLHGPELVRDDIRKSLEQERSGKIFLDTKVEKQEKISISLLWRTQAVSLEEALKLILFLVKLAEDEEISKHLDLEILVSQEIPDIHADKKTHMPIIIAFDNNAFTDHDQIMQNLLAIQKTTEQGGSPTIVQDADALKLQRDRLLAHNPGAKRKFAFDLWDEAAIQNNVENPMNAVKKQITKTQEALQGHAFCFVLKEQGASRDTPGKWYGDEHYLLEKSPAQLIKYLDIIVRTMIQYSDTYAAHVKERIAQELGIYLD